MVPCGVPAVIKSTPAGIPQVSDPSSPWYSRNIHNHPRETHRFRGISAVPIPVHTSSPDPRLG